MSLGFATLPDGAPPGGEIAIRSPSSVRKPSSRMTQGRGDRTMKNEIKKVLVGCAGMGVLAFALATSPARAAEPSSNPMAPTAGGAVPQPKAEKTQIQHESV